MPMPTLRRTGPPAGRARGFTLIEVLIAVVIVGILASVALPSYQSYVRRGNRADARTLLQGASLAQEKFRLGNTSYASAVTALAPPCPTSGTCASSQGHYSLAVSNASATGYTLTANATSTVQLADAGCTALVLTAAGTAMTYTPANCWSK